MVKNIEAQEISNLLKKELERFEDPLVVEEVGRVIQVGDGIVRVYGLQNVTIGEIVLFENDVQGLVLHLDYEWVGIIVISVDYKIQEGDLVRRGKKEMQIEVGEGMIGRVVNSLGKAVDGKGDISGKLYPMPIERKGPDVLFRGSICEPLVTGTISIDALLPVGLGQRMVFLGDRQSSKTTVAVNLIMNQRTRFERGDPVYCIYVAIGQKASNVVYLKKLLESKGAMDYTIIVMASASESSSIRFLSPFSATSIGEFFRDTGRKAVIIYDDLSKHAIAYREISLLLRRPPGREAYPPDIFYLHARLLERSAKISENQNIASKMNDLPTSLKNKIKEGGSLTSFPIIETQMGDISAYIPTNVISITDGQVFFNKEMFNMGYRPAVDVGFSVSRIGGDAQKKIVKKLVAHLKLEQAQFQELESFSKFGIELDKVAKRMLLKGMQNRELLKQRVHDSYTLSQQIIMLYAMQNNLLKDVPVASTLSFMRTYLDYLFEKNGTLMSNLDQKDEIGEDEKGYFMEALSYTLKKFKIEKSD